MRKGWQTKGRRRPAKNRRRQPKTAKKAVCRPAASRTFLRLAGYNGVVAAAGPLWPDKPAAPFCRKEGMQGAGDRGKKPQVSGRPAQGRFWDQKGRVKKGAPAHPSAKGGGCAGFLFAAPPRGAGEHSARPFARAYPFCPVNIDVLKQAPRQEPFLPANCAASA